MEKLSKAQQKVLDNLKNTIDVVRKYETYEEFYDNSHWSEQSTFTTGSSCNLMYNTSEKYKHNDLEEFEKSKKEFELCKNENILIVFAKTETIAVLERLGLIKIIKHAKYQGWSETIQVLNY